MAGDAGVLGDRQGEGCAGVEVPDLDGVGHPVPGRDLAGAEEVVDGGLGAAAAIGGPVAVGLAIAPALGVRDEAEQAGDRVGVELAVHPISSQGMPRVYGGSLRSTRHLPE